MPGVGVSAAVYYLEHFFTSLESHQAREWVGTETEEIREDDKRREVEGTGKYNKNDED